MAFALRIADDGDAARAGGRTRTHQPISGRSALRAGHTVAGRVASGCCNDDGDDGDDDEDAIFTCNNCTRVRSFAARG